MRLRQAAHVDGHSPHEPLQESLPEVDLRANSDVTALLDRSAALRHGDAPPFGRIL